MMANHNNKSNNNNNNKNKTNNAVSSVLKGFDNYSEEKQQTNQLDEIIQRTKTYQFTPKHQYSMKNNPLCGICFPQWLSILRQRYREIEWFKYWPRLLFLTFMSIINSLLAFIEWILYGDIVNSTTTPLHPSPVFILGHPRTGTTLLHSLLALDDDRWAICSTFCAAFPSSFLWLERYKCWFTGVMDDTRPMDNVKLDFDLPQEDEIATNVLSGGMCSPYMPLFFMRQEPEYRAFYSFENENGDNDNDSNNNNNNETTKNKNRWIQAFLFLCHKLTLRAAITSASSNNTTSQPKTKKRLLLKSPVHTARMKLLLQLFPAAQFIYIHRHPYDVFRSAAHMADTTYWYTYLNTPTNAMIQEFILRQYEILWETYEEGRKHLSMLQQQQQQTTTKTAGKSSQPPPQLLEVSFDELTTDTIGTMKKIYTHFEWTTTSWKESDIYSKLIQEIPNVQSYQKNTFRSLSSTLEQIIDERWGPSFERLGYRRRCDDNKNKTV